MVKEKVISLLFIICCYSASFAQARFSLSGTVTDSKGEPIPAATIVIKDSTNGTYTDVKGKYKLTVNAGKYILEASMLGYESKEQEVDISANKTLDFVLSESSVDMGSVMVYGKTKSQELREGAFAVNALQIKPLLSTVHNLNSVINKTSGIRIREEGGVGSEFDLSINGMSGNSVRYFLDGMPLDAKGSGVTLANLPLNIIERVEIYKGVIPASLGSDALGGAINIITNQDKKNFLDVSYGIGSFHTHKFDLSAQYVLPKTGIFIKPVIGANYSKITI